MSKIDATDTTIFLRDKNIWIEIPYHSGKMVPYQIIWIKKVPGLERTYEVSLRSKDAGYTGHLVDVYPDGRFIPWSSTMVFTEQEYAVLKFAAECEQDIEEIKNQIYRIRYKEQRANG